MFGKALAIASAGIVLTSASSSGAAALTTCYSLSQAVAFPIDSETGRIADSHQGIVDQIVAQATLRDDCHVAAVSLTAFAERDITSDEAVKWAEAIRGTLVEGGITPSLIDIKHGAPVADQTDPINRVEVEILMSGPEL